MYHCASSIVCEEIFNDCSSLLVGQQTNENSDCLRYWVEVNLVPVDGRFGHALVSCYLSHCPLSLHSPLLQFTSSHMSLPSILRYPIFALCCGHQSTLIPYPDSLVLPGPLACLLARYRQAKKKPDAANQLCGRYRRQSGSLYAYAGTDERV